MMKMFLMGLFVLALGGCDLTGLERSKAEDNRQTNVTINEAVGESLYLDEAGWSWLIDRFGNVVDGPFDIGNQFGPDVVPPEFPVPPPPPLFPDAQEAAAGWWVVLLLPGLLGLSGCVAVGDNARVQMFERAEANASLAASIGSRTQAGSAAAKEGGAEGNPDSLTEGGGTVKATQGQTPAPAPTLPTVPPEGN
jgi:hypothetical protein